MSVQDYVCVSMQRTKHARLKSWVCSAEVFCGPRFIVVNKEKTFIMIYLLFGLGGC